MTQQATPSSPLSEAAGTSAGAAAGAAPGQRPQAALGAGGGPVIQRQFVNFAFYKLDPAFRRLGDHEKIQARSEFLSVLSQRRPGLMCLTYSTVGLRPESDFLLWRIAAGP